MSVLVTGAAGFIGAPLVRRLAHAFPGEEIWATDVAPREGDAAGPENVRVAPLDVTDRAATREMMLKVRPRALVHAAALTLRDDEARMEVFEVNLGGTVSVLAAAAEAGVERVVVASSSMVYSGPQSALRREDDPLDAGSAYTASKIAAEAAAEHAGAVAVRIAPTYGPGEVARPSRPRTSAPAQLAAALREGRAVRVSGADAVRDWTHVDDVAAGIVGLVTAGRLAHPVYNLGAGAAVRFGDVVAAFAAHGLVAEWGDGAEAIAPDTSGEASAPLATDRIRAETGFTPEHDLESGIGALIAGGAGAPA